jgi:ATP-dependent DNA ligase
MGRHNQNLTNFQISRDEIIENLYKPLNIKGGWLVLNGETLNKSKRDERGFIFNQKLILFDILVLDSDYLIGKTFEERIDLLDNLYGQNPSDKEYFYGISDNIYHSKSYDSGFKNLFDTYTKVEIIEGLVMKRKNAKLELAIGEKNNWRSQIKCRKPEKNYRY